MQDKNFDFVKNCNIWKAATYITLDNEEVDDSCNIQESICKDCYNLLHEIEPRSKLCNLCRNNYLPMFLDKCGDDTTANGWIECGGFATHYQCAYEFRLIISLSLILEILINRNSSNANIKPYPYLTLKTAVQELNNLLKNPRVEDIKWENELTTIVGIIDRGVKKIDLSDEEQNEVDNKLHYLSNYAKEKYYNDINHIGSIIKATYSYWNEDDNALSNKRMFELPECFSESLINEFNLTKIEFDKLTLPFRVDSINFNQDLIMQSRIIWLIIFNDKLSKLKYWNLSIDTLIDNALKSRLNYVLEQQKTDNYIDLVINEIIKFKNNLDENSIISNHFLSLFLKIVRDYKEEKKSLQTKKLEI